jgi:hypothetical protein
MEVACALDAKLDIFNTDSNPGDQFAPGLNLVKSVSRGY